MSITSIGRIAAGVGIGAAAIGAGLWAADANTARTKRITIERGDGNKWDDLGIPGGIPDVTGLFAGVAALGGAALVARGSIGGRQALLAAPAAAALGAVAGFMVGRRVGEHQGRQDPDFAVSEARNERERDAERAENDADREARMATSSLERFRAEWNVSATADDITFDAAARTLMGAYDHNDDGSVDIRSGQPMPADERVADDHASWRRGAFGPVTDDDHQVETLLPWFSGADSSGDQRVSVAEVAAKLAATLDDDGNGRLDAQEGVEGTRPRGDEINDYKDFEG